MGRADVTQDAILERFVARLRDQLDLNKSTCYETINPESPSLPKSGDFFCTVNPGESAFVDGEQDVGNVTEQWNVDVTVYSRVRLDPADHDEELFRNERRGLFVLKQKVLKALVGWDPQTKSRQEFVRQLIYATHAKPPQYDRDQGIGWLTITFAVDFDWDLES